MEQSPSVVAFLAALAAVQDSVEPAAVAPLARTAIAAYASDAAGLIARLPRRAMTPRFAWELGVALLDSNAAGAFALAGWAWSPVLRNTPYLHENAVSPFDPDALQAFSAATLVDADQASLELLLVLAWSEDAEHMASCAKLCGSLFPLRKPTPVLLGVCRACRAVADSRREVPGPVRDELSFWERILVGCGAGR